MPRHPWRRGVSCGAGWPAAHGATTHRIGELGLVVACEREPHERPRAVRDVEVARRGECDAKRARLGAPATQVVAFPIDETSAKVRSGPPIAETGDDEALRFRRGIIPIALVRGDPVPG